MNDTKRTPSVVAMRVGEFRALWSAEMLSVFGDQVARVALALLVFARTNSAVLAALTYALTFVPAILGGLLLSGLADRFPRRTVIVVADAGRGCLAAAMAVPGVPLPVLWGLIGLLTVVGAPFKAAQLALITNVLPKDALQAGQAVRQVGSQIAQVAGFGLGGVLVLALGTTASLALNAATFFVSAAIVRVWVRSRSAPTTDQNAEDSVPAGRPDGRLIAIFMLAGLTGLLVVPEGLAAPFASAAGVASFGVGLLMAADPVGSAVGGWWAARRPVEVSSAWRPVIVPAVLAGVPLGLCAVLPGAWWAAALWAISGILSTIYLVRMVAAVGQLVPNARRGAVMGRLSTCLYTSQGVAILCGGVVADQVGPATAVALAGAAAIFCAVVAGLVWQSARPRQVRGVADEPAPAIAA
ncbi:MFS transporter [Amycolatopsis sp. NPDC047767]|uniref:MFS transporter n=1 Tax=Amycolatopsis sp. NPDC047767 TaxID=3156765 RepID=UPI0034518608